MTPAKMSTVKWLVTAAVNLNSIFKITAEARRLRMRHVGKRVVTARIKDGRAGRQQWIEAVSARQEAKDFQKVT